MKNLILIRHAKSSWDNPDWTDFDRPLNKRGLRDAPFMAEILNKKGKKPDLFISSPAKRAIETAIFFANEFKYPEEKIIQDIGIYDRGYKYITNILSNLKQEQTTVFLFGHNPDITSLSSYFSGEYFDNVPTCGIVSIIFKFNDWKNITFENGSLEFFEYPKNYFKN